MSTVAREVIPIEDLKKLGNEFQSVAEKLASCVKIASEAGMSAVLIHVKTLRNTHLPEVKDWVESTANDVRLEANAFRDGRLSKAQKSVKRAESQKKAASGKPKKNEKKGK